MSGDPTLRGRKAVVLGLGIEGIDLVRFLRASGAEVTVFDTRERAAVADAAAEAETLGARVKLGLVDPGRADEFELLYASQSALLHRDPFVLRMRELGRPISSMLREFMRRWPGPVLGITGSSGKTTTTSLTAAIFAEAGVAHILGGNIGRGLLAQLDAGAPDTWAVLEISHTQLQLLDRPPRVAVVTNVTPNHLDQFSWDDYVDLKRTLVRHQCAADMAVLNSSDPISRQFENDTAAEVSWFNGDVPGSNSFFVRGDGLVARRGRREEQFLTLDEIPLRGAHNVENVLAAAAAASAADIEIQAVAEAVRGFTPVAHRLEPVAVIDGVTYVNDSIATSPERTMAGIRSFSEPLVLLLGGRDKHLPLEELAAMAHARARAIVCFGEAGPMLTEVLGRRLAPAGSRVHVARTGSMDDAVRLAAGLALPGDVVLLSPACTSFDAYPNFERRGERFRELVQELANAGREAGAPSRT